jgi:hypothetical protein
MDKRALRQLKTGWMKSEPGPPMTLGNAASSSASRDQSAPQFDRVWARGAVLPVNRRPANGDIRPHERLTPSAKLRACVHWMGRCVVPASAHSPHPI